MGETDSDVCAAHGCVVCEPCAEQRGFLAGLEQAEKLVEVQSIGEEPLTEIDKGYKMGIGHALLAIRVEIARRKA